MTAVPHDFDARRMPRQQTVPLPKSVLENLVGKLGGDFRDSIGAERIHKDNLVRPANAFEASTDVRLVVVADDYCGNLWSVIHVARLLVSLLLKSSMEKRTGEAFLLLQRIAGRNAGRRR